MKTKQEILKDLFATLAELQSGTATGDLKVFLQHRLNTLYWVLGEDVPEEFWQQVEDAINEE